MIIVDIEDSELLENAWMQSKGYVLIWYEGKEHLLHRVIASRIVGHKLSKLEHVDHINGNKKDNTRENLRVVTNAQNLQNRGKNKNNKSGVKGVIWISNRHKWRAAIGINNKNIHLGYFDNLDEAEKAYHEAALLHHKEYAKW